MSIVARHDRDRGLTSSYRWGITLSACGLVVCSVWLALTDAPSYRFLVSLLEDPQFLKQRLEEWGLLAPVLFVALQVLQVIISPIPGEATGFLGGYLFGQWLGLLYSMIGLTIGSVASFGVGRWLGAPYVRGLVGQKTWERLSFIIGTKGVFFCFIVYLIPGLPKDIVCYLFGISPISFWAFAFVSTLGRIPGTWVLSAQGSHTANGDYVRVILLTAAVVAITVPLYYYRNRIVCWFRGQETTPCGRREPS
jgi:uncharacterized membrane protein YdjX (TVP38/TMEM64 family)